MQATHPDTPGGTEESRIRTFLIADVRGYTRFTLERGDPAAAELTQKLGEHAHEEVTTHDGQIVELRGDEILAVFHSARQALRAAVDLQGRLRQATADDPSFPLPVGIGIDAGEAIAVAGGYRGAALNMAARLCSLAGPGEVLASDAVVHLARQVQGIVYAERGTAQLKGFADPVRIVQVLPDEAAEATAASPASSSTVPLPLQRLPIGGFLGSLPEGRLVGREVDVESVARTLDAVEDSNGRLVLVSGEPGVGKTRLTQEITLHARNRGFLIAAGRCYEGEGITPYYPFLDILTTLITWAPSELRRDAGRRWPYLARLLPELLGVPPPNSPEGSDEQQRLLRAITGLVQAIAQQLPIALLLDDLHWADGASLKLLHHLAHSTATDRVLLMGTYRDVEVSRRHPLEATLRDLEREGLTHRIVLRRLDRAGTRALIAETMGEQEISDAFTALLHDRTEGNPFFVQQVLRALAEQGDLYREDGRWERKEIAEIVVPESIRSVIGQRLSRLREETQEALRVASVLGQSFRFDELRVMTARGEAELEGILEEAVKAGLVRETDEYAFDHALTQATLYGELSSRRRRRLHALAGEALEGHSEREQRIGELAWHFLQADDAARALPYALQAGDHDRATFAHAEAEAQYRTALALAEDLRDRDREAEAREKLGMALRLQAQYDEAVTMLEAAAELHRDRGDLEGVRRVVALLGHVHAARTTPEEGIQRIQALLLDSETTEPSPGLASLYAALAQLYFVTGRYHEQLAAATQASALAGAVGDEHSLAIAEGRRGLALGVLGDMKAEVPILEAVIPLAERVNDLDTLGRTLNNISVAYLSWGDFPRHRDYVQRGLDTAERLGDHGQLVFMTAKLALVEMYEGNWETSRKLAERSLALSDSLRISWDSFAPRQVLGQLSYLQGNWDAATRYVTESLTIAERSGDLQAILLLNRFLAESDLLQHRPEAAMTRLAALVERAGVHLQGAANPLPTLAEAYLELGRTDRVRELLDGALRRARDQDDRLLLVDARRVEGMFLSRQGKGEEATAAFAESAALAAAMPFPLGEACARLEWGLHDLRRGERGAAREQLDQALILFRRLGAHPYIVRAEEALAEIEEPGGEIDP